jgi:thioredoxin 1
MIDAVTDATFDAQVLSATTPVLVELGASWCPPCRAMAPVLAEIARERQDRLRLVTVDSDANPKIVERFGVMSVPTFLLFSAGKQIDRVVGYTAKPKLLRILDEALSENVSAR